MELHLTEEKYILLICYMIIIFLLYYGAKTYKRFHSFKNLFFLIIDVVIWFVSNNGSRKKDYTFSYYYVNIKRTIDINLLFLYYGMLNISNRFILLIK